MATAQTLEPETTDSRSTEPPLDVRKVVADFDQASRSVRIPLRLRVMYWLYYIALAHRGKSVYSSTMDAQYEPGFLLRGYQKYCGLINRRFEQLPAQAKPIEVPAFRSDQLAEGDMAFLIKSRIPFVLRGAAKDSAMGRWDLDYLDRVAGDCEVPVNAALDKPSEDYSLPTKSHHYYDFHMGKVREVTDSIRAGGNLRLTVAEDIMHEGGDRLLNDVDVPFWETLTGWDKNQSHWLRSKLFVGKVFSTLLLVQPQDSYSLWHTEPGDAFFALSKGSKTWTMAHPLYTAPMLPRIKKTTNYTGSNIDSRESNSVLKQRGFGAYLAVPKVAIRIEAGDMLRVPNLWWHTVETHPGDYTVAVTMRIEPGPNLVAPGFLCMGLLDKQAKAVARAYLKHGRISDNLIGQPRKSRSANESPA